MSKLLNLINNEDTCKKNEEDIPYVFDANKFEIDDMDPNEMKIQQDFFKQFANAVFGKVINNL